MSRHRNLGTLRALAECCSPRDLYGVVNIYRHADLVEDAEPVLAALERKCAHVGIPVPDADTIADSSARDELDREWANMLGHQSPHLPNVSDFWEQLDEVFRWLAGNPSHDLSPLPVLAEIDPTWKPPRAMAAWRFGVPLELLRFAGANRLKVEIDHRTAYGRRDTDIVAPYSFRMARSGDLLLVVPDDGGQLFSHRVERFDGVRILRECFEPQ